MPAKSVKAKQPAPVKSEKAKEVTKSALPETPDRPAERAIKDEYITLDLQTVIIPAVVLISAVILSIILILGVRNINNSIKTARDEILTAIDSIAGSAGTTEADTAAATATTGSSSIGTAPYIGDKAKAKVAIIEFSDYECPFCIRHASETFAQLVKDYVDTGDIIYVYRDNIAVPSHNPKATAEAEAAKCVQKIAGNNAYFTFHDAVFTDTAGNGAGTKTDLYTLASGIGVDSAAFRSCLDNGDTKAAVAADIAAADAAGMQGTPGFIVGTLNSDGTVSGDVIRGAYPLSTFTAAIEKYL